MDDKLTSPCPVCNKEISKKAQSCPHCGEPFVVNTRQQKIKQESSPVVKYGGGCLLVFIGLFIIGGLLDSKKPPQRPTSIEVSQKEYGEKWPYTIPSGVLQCRTRVVAGYLKKEITITYNGTRYAVNGSARTAGFADFRPIWRDDPKRPGAKVWAGDIIERGLTLCEE